MGEQTCEILAHNATELLQMEQILNIKHAVTKVNGRNGARPIKYKVIVGREDRERHVEGEEGLVSKAILLSALFHLYN